MAGQERPGSTADNQAPETHPNDPIQEIVRCNVQSGRFERAAKFHKKGLSLEAYTDLVTLYYFEHQPLISCLTAGEPAAWEQLWRRLFRRAYSLLISRNWDAGQASTRAQEAAQETCLSLYRQRYPYDCPFEAWVFNILRHHVFRSYHRLRNPLDFPGISDIPEEMTGQESELAALERNELILHALGNLSSEAQRQVIESLFFEGLSSEETAKKLGKTTQAVYNLKARALDQLRGLLAEE